MGCTATKVGLVSLVVEVSVDVVEDVLYITELDCTGTDPTVTNADVPKVMLGVDVGAEVVGRLEVELRDADALLLLDRPPETGAGFLKTSLSLEVALFTDLELSFPTDSV